MIQLVVRAKALSVRSQGFSPAASDAIAQVLDSERGIFLDLRDAEGTEVPTTSSL